VARLAGVPREVIAAARHYLATLERRAHETAPPGPQAELSFAAPAPATAGASADPALLANLVATELAALDPDVLTPREALDALYRLKSLGR
jgi:DNA mismatch repair protein MutS